MFVLILHYTHSVSVSQQCDCDFPFQFTRTTCSRIQSLSSLHCALCTCLLQLLQVLCFGANTKITFLLSAVQIFTTINSRFSNWKPAYSTVQIIRIAIHHFVASAYFPCFTFSPCPFLSSHLNNLRPTVYCSFLNLWLPSQLNDPTHWGWANGHFDQN